MLKRIQDLVVRAVSLTVLAGALAACTSGSEPTTNAETATSSTGTTSGGGEVPVDPQKDCPEGEICMKAPSQGFQVQTVGEKIEPGQDVEYCEVVELPGSPDEVYHVSGFEVAMTSHSHHLIVVAAIPGSATEAAIKAGDRKKCFTPDVFGGEITSVTGSQKPYHADAFPAGVGKVFRGGQKLIFDYHYFNATNAQVQARGAVNFHVVPESEIKHLARNFGFYNFDIKTPPQSTKSFEAECAFSHDVMVPKITRHTHQWGRDFSVEYAGGPKDGEHIWTSPDYEETEYKFPEPVLMPKGTGFRFTCEFVNDTDKLLKFGVTASDEMCILFGVWYSPKDGAPEDEQGCQVF